MEKSEWKEVAMMLNVLYDDGKSLMFEKDDLEKMQAWYSCLCDLEYVGVAKAVKNIVLKSPYRPKVSDIRKEYALITRQAQLTEQQAWSIVREAIRDSLYHANEHFDEFPDIVKKAVVDPMQLAEWGQCESSEVDTIIQSLFKRQFRTLLDQEAEDAVLGQIGARVGELIGIEQKTQERLVAKDE